MWATYILFTIAVYVVLGITFAVYFLSRGAAKLDHSAIAAPLFAKLLWLPATVALWPLLLSKCLKTNQA